MVRQTAACFYRPRCHQKAFREDAFVLILNGFWLSPSHQSGAKISFSFLPTAVTVSSTFFPCHVVYVRLNPWGLEWVQGPLGYLIVPFGCLARQLLVVKDFLYSWPLQLGMVGLGPSQVDWRVFSCLCVSH